MNITEKRENDFGLIFIILLGVMLFYPPFFSGLFFESYWLPYQVFIGILAVLFLAVKRSNGGMVSLKLFDVTTAALVMCYIFSVFVAVNVRGAVGETLKIGTYFLLFYLISCSISSVKDVVTILKTFYWSGIGATLISLGTAFGTFDYPGAFKDGRIYSTLQYPNSFAAYTIGLLIIGLYLTERKQKQYWQIIYSVTNFLFLVGFFGAKSRGGLLTLLAILLIYFIGLPGKYRLSIVTKTIFSALIAFLYINNVFSQIPRHGSLYYWGLMTVACLLSILPDIVKGMVPNLNIAGKRRNIIVYGLIGIILVGAMIGFTISSFRDSDIQSGKEQAVNRFSEISLSSRNSQERLVFYQDALKIVKDHPLLGTGGRGWTALYRQYQGYNYATTEVHNQFLQVWVESGTLGFIAFLSIWVAAIITAVHCLKRVTENEDKLLIWTILCAALALGMHSLLDFNLSIPAIAVLLWGLFGCIRAFQRLTEAREPIWQIQLPIKGRILKLGSLVLTGLFLSISLVLLISLNYGDKGIEKLHQRAFVPARDELKKAVQVNPLAGNYLASLAESLMWLGNDNDNEQDLKSALVYINKAIRLEPRNPDYRLVKGKILLLLDQVEQAVSEFEKASELSPYEQNYADYLAETYFLVGKYFYEKEDKTKAKKYLAKAAVYPELVTRRINIIEPRYKELQKPELMLVISKQMDTARNMAVEMLAKVI